MGIPPRTYGALQVKLRESLVTRALVLPIQQFIHIQGISSFFLLAAAILAIALGELTMAGVLPPRVGNAVDAVTARSARARLD